MSSTTRDNSGSISRNDKKLEDRHPDIKGKAMVAGVEYWVSGWLKENDRGKWYSLSFTPKDQPAEQPAPAARGKPSDLDDSRPF